MQASTLAMSLGWSCINFVFNADFSMVYIEAQRIIDGFLNVTKTSSEGFVGLFFPTEF